jgi:integrase
MWVERNGRTYRIRDTAGGRKVTLAQGYATKTAAKNAMATMRAEALRGDALVPRGGELTVAEWLDMWWPPYSSGLSKQTSRVSTQGVMDRYVRALLGPYPLDDVSPIVVQRWVADLLAGRTNVRNPRALAAKTVRNAHGLLHKILADAVAQRLIRSNPCERTRLPGEVHVEMMFLDEAQADRLVQAMPEHWRPLVVCLLGTGLRWGEALGLRVRHVDVLAGRLQVLGTLQEIGGRFVEQTPKSAAGRRTVTFPRTVADQLVPTVVDKSSDNRVFLGPAGGLIRRKEFYPIWHRARTAAGLAGLRIHDLRHTHIGWLISAGVPLTAISRRVGHSSITVTSDRYGHLLPEVDTAIVAATEVALAKVTP